MERTNYRVQAPRVLLHRTKRQRQPRVRIILDNIAYDLTATEATQLADRLVDVAENAERSTANVA